MSDSLDIVTKFATVVAAVVATVAALARIAKSPKETAITLNIVRVWGPPALFVASGLLGLMGVPPWVSLFLYLPALMIVVLDYLSRAGTPTRVENVQFVLTCSMIVMVSGVLIVASVLDRIVDIQGKSIAAQNKTMDLIGKLRESQPPPPTPAESTQKQENVGSEKTAPSESNGDATDPAPIPFNQTKPKTADKLHSDERANHNGDSSANGWAIANAALTCLGSA